ncbi:MAG: hypothetical protein ACTH3S_14745 [Marinobacter sp.]|uniref:hypothetical protein n=1 Tax=Marinobacter sp. TaxID=50741 RepID=UPI003F9C0ACB
MHKDPPVSKVFYRPIEAAIRWAGLLRYYQDILFAISSPRELSLTLECPRWDELRLCIDRSSRRHHGHHRAHLERQVRQRTEEAWRMPA